MWSICRTVINVGSVAILILEHRSLGEGFKLILRRTDDFLLPWHRQEIEVGQKKSHKHIGNGGLFVQPPGQLKRSGEHNEQARRNRNYGVHEGCQWRLAAASMQS